MSIDSIRKDLSDLVQKLLVQAASLPGLESLVQGECAAQDRLIAIEAKENGFRVELASDGLSLEQKTQLERHLLEGTQGRASGITVYFKRRQSLAGRISGTPTPGPSSAPSPSPFGVKMRHKPIPGVQKVVAVSSGKGGVGKSTVAVNLAVGLALQGLKVGLLDADLYGPSAPTLLGINGTMPISPDQKMVPLERHGVKVVSFGFMSDPYSPVIWRGPMIAKALEQLFYQCTWGELDYLIIDLPPGTGDVQLTMIENLPLHGGIVVSTPQVVALLDAHKGLSMFEKLKVPVIGLVENMSHFQCSSCGHLEDVFGQAQIERFAEERRVPIIARIPLNRRIRECSDQGEPVVMSDPSFAQYYLEAVEALLRYEVS